jgi:hypothetical protein
VPSTRGLSRITTVNFATFCINSTSAIGTKRTSRSRSATSAFGGKADIAAKLLTRDEARLQLHRGFTDADLDDAVRAALTGLVQSVA